MSLLSNFTFTDVLIDPIVIKSVNELACKTYLRFGQKSYAELYICFTLKNPLKICSADRINFRE